MMRLEMFEGVETTACTSDSLPFRSTQDAAIARNFMHLALLSVLAAVIVLPQIAVAGYALTSPVIRQSLLAQPIVSFQLAVALMFWIGLFAWALRALYARLTLRRTIEITPETVAVADLLAFGGSTWTAPLSSFKGVAHHIRSSLAGSHHELILVHPDAKRCVLLMAGEHISDADINRMTRLLRMPQVPASELYRMGKTRVKAERLQDKPMVWNALPA